MTELSFLLELLLNHKIEKPTKDLIVNRIRDVEAGIFSQQKINYGPAQVPQSIPGIMPIPYQQAPSTLALMAKHGDIPKVPKPEMPPIEPVAVIAQTPATAAAMNSRNEAIAQSIAGKIDKVTGRPKKW